MTTKKQTIAQNIETPEANRDVVAQVSYRADGTPDQTPDFVVIGDEPEADERVAGEPAGTKPAAKPADQA